nr:putative reverse transcriptase domain-containing protein [Tanacetum cinerariifolium]
LSKNKAEIVCHEKVVRIPLEGGEILHVQRERTLGGTKALMSTREDEPELSDIPVVRHFIDVFLKDLSGLPPQRKVSWVLLTFYREIAKPFTSLIEKNKKYEWGVEQEEAFLTLKDNFCNASILSLPDGVEDFVVYWDTSNQGLDDYVSVLNDEEMMPNYSLDDRKFQHKEDNLTVKERHSTCSRPDMHNAKVSCDGLSIYKPDGKNEYTYSQRILVTLDVLIQACAYSNKHPELGVLQHDNYVDRSVLSSINIPRLSPFLYVNIF